MKCILKGREAYRYKEKTKGGQTACLYRGWAKFLYKEGYRVVVFE